MVCSLYSCQMIRGLDIILLTKTSKIILLQERDKCMAIVKWSNHLPSNPRVPVDG